MRSLLYFACVALAAPQHLESQQTVDASSLRGKWLYGYQGWFRSNGFKHWSANSKLPGPGNVNFDFLPDVSHYPPNCLFSSGLTLPNGSKAKLYDNTCNGVVDLHFKWMANYGIDGIIVQRFLSALDDKSFLTVLDQVQAAAEKYGRVFMIEYDVSGGDSSKGSVTNKVLNDWNNKVKKYTQSKSYIHQNGNPAVMIFGIGFPSKHTSSADGLSLVKSLKKAAHVSLGVPKDWAETVNKKGEYAQVFTAADVLSPWTVGGYNNANFPIYNKQQQADIKATNSLKMGYAPTIWPGTSAGHLNGVNDPSKLDYYPRYNGTFYEKAAKAAIQLKPFFVYNAMFDEINEGTGMYATLRENQLPTNYPFAGIDNNMDNNYYLKLGGQLAASFN